MASLIYSSFIEDCLKGKVDCSVDTFKVMALGAAYAENKETHSKRSQLTNEITGTGYIAGGATVSVSVTRDTANNRIDVSLGAASWPNSTLAGVQKFAYYKSRGGAATADELVAVIDNGSPVSTSAGTLTLNASTLRHQN